MSKRSTLAAAAAMAWGMAIGLCGCTAAPVNADPSIQITKVCARQQFGFGEPLSLALPQDAAVARRFSPVCEELLRQDGLQFQRDLTAYTCRAFLPRSTEMPSIERMQEYRKRFPRITDAEWDEGLAAERRRVEANKEVVAKIEAALGERLTLASFDEAAANYEDLVEAEYARRVQAGTAVKGLPIAYSSLYVGTGLTLVLLADVNGRVIRVIHTRQDLDSSLGTVKSASGAADLLEMRKLVGMLSDLLGPEFPRPLCASNVIEDANGWMFKGVEILRECAPSVVREFRITRIGETRLVQQSPYPKSMQVCH